MSKMTRDILKPVCGATLLVAWSIPIAWVLFCALHDDLQSGIPSSFWSHWTLANFWSIQSDVFLRALWNSFAVASISALLSTVAALSISVGLMARARPRTTLLLWLASARAI